jgi:hypothetical protein
MSELNLLNLKLTPFEIIDIWKKKYAEPYNVETQKALAIVKDPEYKWRDKDQKEFAELKYKKMDTTNIDNFIMVNAMTRVVTKHNLMIAALKRLHLTWSTQVAYEGKQQKEMMQGQADILQEIFAEIKKITDEEV